MTATAGFAISYLLDRSLVIKQITVTTNTADTPVYGLHQFTGWSMVTTSPESIEDAIRRANPHLESTWVTKQYPDQIQVTVIQRPVAAAIVSSEGWMLLADDATIMRKQRSDEEPSQPVIEYYQTVPHHQFQAGDRLDHHDIRIALTGTKMLADLGFETDTITIDSFDRVALITTDGAEIILSTEKSLDDQQHLLETLIGGLRRQESDFSSIDLRFDRPILVPNP